jgi:hypothetical protein
MALRKGKIVEAVGVQRSGGETRSFRYTNGYLEIPQVKILLVF